MLSHSQDELQLKKYISYMFFIIIAYGKRGNKQAEGGSRGTFRDWMKIYKCGMRKHSPRAIASAVRRDFSAF